MIFLEFVVINKWGVNRGTTFNINKRSIEEIINLNNEVPLYDNKGDSNEESFSNKDTNIYKQMKNDDSMY